MKWIDLDNNQNQTLHIDELYLNYHNTNIDIHFELYAYDNCYSYIAVYIYVDSKQNEHQHPKKID